MSDSDSESLSCRSIKKSKNENSIERHFNFDKKLVVELCDFMVCYKENCNIPDYEIYKNKRTIPKNKSTRINKDLNYKEADLESEDSDFEDKDILKKKKIHQNKKKKKSKYVDEDSESEEEVIEEENEKEDEDSDWEDEDTKQRKKKKLKLEKKKKDMEKKKEKIKDSDWEDEDTKQRKKKKLKLEKEPLSGYELMRKKNLDDKMAFLKSLKINEIVDDLEETAKSASKRKPRVFKPIDWMNILESRKSKRMENVIIDLSEKAVEKKMYDNLILPTEKVKKELPPTVYPFTKAFCEDEQTSLSNYDEYFGNLKIEEGISGKGFSYDLGKFDEGNFSVYTVPFNVATLDFHPALDRTIMLAGSSSGEIALMNLDTDPYVCAPHTARVSLIKVNPEYSSQILSSSIDGTVRQTDLEKQHFLKILEDDSPCNYFDFISPDEFLVAHKNGCVSLVDTRTRGSRLGCRMTATQWRCGQDNIRTISSHPSKKEYCLSLDSMGLLKVWDIRNQRKYLCAKSVDKYVLSAFYSPITGNSILCSSKKSIYIYHSSSSVTTPFCEIFHTNRFNINHTSTNIDECHQNRRKTEKRSNELIPHISRSTHYTTAKWVPNSDDTFLVGNNLLKKVMILQSNDGKELCNLNYSSNVNFQAVHPGQNMLALLSDALMTLKLYVNCVSN